MHHASQTLTVAFSPESEARARALADQVASAWPVHAAAPRVHFVSLLALLTQLEEAQAMDQVTSGTVLVVLDAKVPTHAVYQLADELATWSIAALLAFESITPAHEALESSGVIVSSATANPATLAVSLHALAVRQSTIRSLARDLAIAAKAQGGLGGQMDRIHDELNLAALVQQETLPKHMPRLEGLDCAAMMRPAGYVSGDVYDVCAIDDHRIVFFIADAVGHGVPAALMTMVISRALRVDRAEQFISPGATLSRLNEELCRGQRESGRFTTAVYGVIDARTRRVTMASAGHPPPILLGPQGMTRIPTDGALLGIFPEERYADIEFTLQPGETLLLFSDGFEMAFESDAEAKGRKRHARESDSDFEHYVQRLGAIRWPDGHGKRSAAQSIEELILRVDEQAGSLHQIDDLTAIAINATHIGANRHEPLCNAA